MLKAKLVQMPRADLGSIPIYAHGPCYAGINPQWLDQWRSMLGFSGEAKVVRITEVAERQTCQVSCDWDGDTKMVA